MTPEQTIPNVVFGPTSLFIIKECRLFLSEQCPVWVFHILKPTDDPGEAMSLGADSVK